jgi:hypothetical protein
MSAKARCRNLSRTEWMLYNTTAASSCTQVCGHWYWPNCKVTSACILTLQCAPPLYFQHATCLCTLISDKRQEHSETARCLLHQEPPCLFYGNIFLSLHAFSRVINIRFRSFKIADPLVPNQNEVAHPPLPQTYRTVHSVPWLAWLPLDAASYTLSCRVTAENMEQN